MKMIVDATDWVASILRLHAYNILLLCDDRGYNASTPTGANNDRNDNNGIRTDNFMVTTVVSELTASVKGKLFGDLKILDNKHDR